MMKLTKAETADFLRSHDRYRILTHVRPDGDTIGSAAALCRGLRLLGKDAFIVANPGVSDRFAWLHRGLTLPEAGEADTVVSVDVASPNMLPPEFRVYQERIALRIDHHFSSTSFTERELVEPDSASCAEIIWDLMQLLEVPEDTALAEAVYVGTATDTGCFRYANTSAHTFRTAAACADAGVEVYRLNQELFETNTLGRLRMQAWIVDNMKLLQGGKVALCAISKATETAMGVTQDDMDNISGFPRTVAGVCVAATLRESDTGEAKLSVRAVPGYDAARIAARFGGGGHKGAAGGSIRLPLEQAAQAVEAVLLEEMP